MYDKVFEDSKGKIIATKRDGESITAVDKYETKEKFEAAVNSKAEATPTTLNDLDLAMIHDPYVLDAVFHLRKAVLELSEEIKKLKSGEVK
jgi:ABC-type metal ion transport system substrate-binding protein